METNTNTTEAAVKTAKAVKAGRTAVYEGQTEIGVLDKILSDLAAARDELRGEHDDSLVTPTYATERKIRPPAPERTRARPACRAALHVADADVRGEA